MEAHIVMFITGEFEMRRPYPIRIFLDKQAAEVWVFEQNQKLFEASLHEDNLNVLEFSLREKYTFTEEGLEISNKGLGVDYTGASVYLSSVPCS